MTSIEIKIPDLLKEDSSGLSRGSFKSLSREALRLCGDYLIGVTQQRWDDEVDPSGNKWPPLSPKTILTKISRGQSTKILVARGLARKKGLQLIFKGETLTLKFRYKNRYMNLHQLGTKKIPKRQVLGISKKDRESMKIIFVRHLTSQLRLRLS